MKRQTRFVAGGALLLAVVGYLMVTGMKRSMTYYLTASELVSRAQADPTLHDIGVKVNGRVVPGSVRYDQRTLDLSFTLVDIQSGQTRFPVHYQGPLPDTFKEGRDVVVTGRYDTGGTFHATDVLTKCGSRYEAVDADFKGRPT